MSVNDEGEDERLGAVEMGELRKQINRLAGLVRKLGCTHEKTLHFAEQELFEVSDVQESHYVVVSRSFKVIHEMSLHFRDATRIYVQSVKETEGNLQYVQHLLL